MLHDLERVRVLEERLGGNAPPQQAGAAERLLFLDDRHFQPQLRRADRRDVAASARADHQDVVFVHRRLHVCVRTRQVRLMDESGTNAVVPEGSEGPGLPCR